MKIPEQIFERLENMTGKVSLYYRNLVTGERMSYQEDIAMIAASVIKLGLLGEMFRRFEAGEADPEDEVIVRWEDKAPSCGALTYMHDGLRVTLRDLCVLMIILSDNTATNMLFDRTGAAAINRFMWERGLTGMDFNRKMFDDEATARGIKNHINAAGVGKMLEMMYRGELVSPKADEEMIEILKNQRLNHKIPFYLKGTTVAHKTGEDDGISHDVGIIYGREPFVLVMLSNETDVPAFERLIQDTARTLNTDRSFMR